MFPNSIHFNLHNERCSQQSSKFRRNYLSNFHMIIFSAAVSADVSPLPPQAGRMTLRLAWSVY